MSKKIFYAREIQPSEYGTWIYPEYPDKWRIYQSNYTVPPTELPAQFTYSAPFITGAYDFICEYIVTIENEITYYKLTRILYYQNPYPQNLISVEFGTLYLNPDFTNLELLAISELDLLPNASQFKFSALHVAKQFINDVVNFVNNPSLSIAQVIDNCLASYSQPRAPVTRQQRPQQRRLPENLRQQIAVLNHKLSNLQEQISISQQDGRILLRKSEENLQAMAQPQLLQEHNIHIKLELPQEILNVKQHSPRISPLQVEANNNLDDNELASPVTSVVEAPLPLVPEIPTPVVQTLVPTNNIAPTNLSLPRPNYSFVASSLKDAIHSSYEFFLAKKKDFFKPVSINQQNNQPHTPLTILPNNLANQNKNPIISKQNIKTKAKKNKAKNSKNTNRRDDLDIFEEDLSFKDKLLTWSFTAYQAPKKLTQNLLNPEKNLTFSMLMAVNWLIFRTAEYNELVNRQELMQERRAFFKADTMQYVLFALAANLIFIYWAQHESLASSKAPKHKF